MCVPLFFHSRCIHVASGIYSVRLPSANGIGYLHWVFALQYLVPFATPPPPLPACSCAPGTPTKHHTLQVAFQEKVARNIATVSSFALYLCFPYYLAQTSASGWTSPHRASGVGGGSCKSGLQGAHLKWLLHPRVSHVYAYVTSLSTGLANASEQAPQGS